MPDFSSLAISSPDKVQRVCFIDRLGRGSGGVVYRALEFSKTSSPVLRAIKVLRHGSGTTSNDNRELKINRMLGRHPNIAAIHDVLSFMESGSEEPRILLIMDYFSGSDLHRYLSHSPSLVGNTAEVKRIFLHILDAVAFSHKNGVYHRDLKLGNILVDRAVNRVCVADFGCATTAPYSTSYGCGTKGHRCPENLVNRDSSEPYDTRRNDVWSLGIILVQLSLNITGLWRDASPEDPSFAAYAADPSWLRQSLPISRGFAALLERALAIDPAAAIELEDFRRAIVELDTFWLTPAELERAASDIRVLWDDIYRVDPDYDGVGEDEEEEEEEEEESGDDDEDGSRRDAYEDISLVSDDGCDREPSLHSDPGREPNMAERLALKKAITGIDGHGVSSETSMGALKYWPTTLRRCLAAVKELAAGIPIEVEVEVV
ncbi:kinase-like domain-containing protein [Epithele typhae]|uniref:kinase-like domain-containing protein n=1 Tax=Epithele typhae TaxID=378194 RepID=UPI0020075998|nr:kinase-like domain-containing protein [Epithele typhae]KAH9945355.1 kinase-like domain-containing protein [Epithele typhae]